MRAARSRVADAWPGIPDRHAPPNASRPATRWAPGECCRHCRDSREAAPRADPQAVALRAWASLKVWRAAHCRETDSHRLFLGLGPSEDRDALVLLARLHEELPAALAHVGPP